MKWGVGDTVIVGLPVFFVLYMLVNWYCGRREGRVIQAAQNVELEEGITLLEGLQAYFGDGLFWRVSGFRTVGMTAVFGGGPMVCGSMACMDIDQKTGKIEVRNFFRRGEYLEREDPEILIGLLIEAAKKQREA